jgi:hypothetical protein
VLTLLASSITPKLTPRDPKLVWSAPTLKEIEYTEELRRLYRGEALIEEALRIALDERAAGRIAKERAA